ncbi:HD domain-containing protein [Nannocystis sp.]|uniref:HD domain-containing protein n=1 Tax=Nannocystis sp. TaxID=1962667 RepID=UPI002429A91A|nr:HD domain-containing protein [Nannocystis sp.]MBK7829124.1 HD domain-containing protein [Nannocystis sp.]MBK9754815.1 HD domain-containing protein [Nannocystis sp.]
MSGGIMQASPEDEVLLARLAALAEQAMPVDADPAHDILHVRRVAALARTIAAAEGADLVVCVGAALLHELVNLPKDHPESWRSGDLCAEAAGELLRAEGIDAARGAEICACIRDHAFSKGVMPTSLAARVVQDADRLDAIGAVGVARLFATCTAMRTPFYSEHDPLCRTREPDDRRFGLDHFFRKLLRIPAGLHTVSARALAGPRARLMDDFLARFERELAGA